MNEDSSRKKIAIEDLLQIKRAERPPVEFWISFERELRAKQLAAIVQKRSWWQAFPAGLRSLTRFQIPLGAAAALAITVMTVNAHRSPLLKESAVPSSSVQPVSFATGHAAIEVVASPASVVASISEPSAPASEDEKIVTAKIAPGLTPSHDESVEASPLNLAAVSDLVPRLSDARATDTNLAASLPTSSGFESRGLPARSQVTDPLAQVATPKSVRLRDRYLGGALAAGYSMDSSAVSPERSVNHLRDRQLRPEEFSRFDARGNSLSIKL
jgi:hypothetical protein